MATEETIITEPTAVEQTQPQQEIETIDVAQTAETEMPKIEAAAIEETTPLPVAEETTVPVPEPTAIETTTTLGDGDKKIKQSNLNKFYAKVKENPNYTFDQAKSDFGDIKWDEDMFLTYSKYANTRIANKYSLDVLNQKFNEKSGYTIDADIDVNTIPELGKQTPREDLVAISGASGLQLNYSGTATAEPTKAAEPKAVEEAKPKEIKFGADQAFGPGKAQQVQYELAKKRVEGKEKTFPQGWSIAKGKELKVDANPNNEAGIFGGYDLWNIPKDDVTRLRYYSDKMNQVVEGENVKKSKDRAFKAAFGTSFSAGLTDLGLSTGVIDINDLVFTKQNEKDLQNRRNLQNKALKDAAPVIKELADAMTHGNTYYRYFNLEKDASGNTVDYTLNVPKVADAVQRQVYQLLGDGDHSLLEEVIEEEVLKTLVYKAEESESREYFEKIELPKLKKQFPEMFSQTEMAAQFVEGTTDEEIIKKAQAQVEIVAANQEKLRDKEFAPIKQDYEAAAEPLRQSYEIALAKYNEDVKALQLMVDSGAKKPDQAQAELNILNENIKNQQVVVETELKGLYEKLQYDFNRLNTKYNSKVEQEIQKQEKIVGQSINKELAAFAKKRASNPEFVKAFTEAKKRSFTLNEFAMKRELKRDKDERTRTILDNFLLSAQKAFGTTLETYGNMWGADWLRIYGKGLEASTIITPAKVDSWTDAINPFNAAKLGGQLVGVMGPSITAGVVTSYVTGGLGASGAAQAVVSDVVGAVVSWGVNNFEMSQRSFDTKFKETGNVALATDAYNSMMSFQTNEFVYHMADVLPFGKFAKIIKSPILRGITIGGVSYTGELTQEYREGLAEKAINAGMDPYQLIGEQTTGLGNYIKDRMGVDKFQTQGEKEAATASYNYFKETAIATSPLFFGSAGGQYISAKSEAYKRSEASKKGLELFQKYIVDQNSNYKGLRQTLSTITMEKGSAFATMIAESMYAAGHIESKSDRDAIVNTIKAADELIKSPSVQKMDRADRGIYTLLADNYQNTVISLENETDPIQKEALQKRVDDLKKEMSAFATTKKTDVMQLTLSNGQTIFFTPNEMVDFVGKNPEFGYFLSIGLATISPIKGDFTANQKSTLEAINQKIDEYEAKQSPVAPKKQVAATEETAKIKFATFEDAKEYIAERIAEYDSEQAFYDSDEYAQLYPEIKKIYDSEQEFRTVATPDDAVALLESKGYNVGDKVELVTINEMGAPMVLTGTVAILNGRPVINLDENQSTLSGDVVLRINDNWKVTESAKAKPTEEVAPAKTETLKDVDSTTNALNIALREGGEVDEYGYRWLNQEKMMPIYDAFTLQQEKDYRTMVYDDEQKTIEQFISEAYHADKATGKETNLTRAVEDLLTPKTKEVAPATAPAEKPTIELPKVKDEVNNTPVTDRDANNQDVTRYIPFSIVEAANKNDKRSGQTAKQIADRGGYSVKELDMFLPNWRDMLPTATAQPAESTASTEGMVGQQAPTQTQGQPEILLSGLRAGWEAVSYYAFDPRGFRDLMLLINEQKSFAKVVEKNGKKYAVVGLSLAPESRRDAITSGRDNFSFAAVELNENTPSNIVEILEKSAKDNFKNIYQDFSDMDSVSPIKEVDSELSALQTKTKTQEDAVQEQAAGKVPVQPEAGVSETMAQGKPEAEPQVAAEEGKVETATQAEEKVADTEIKDDVQSISDFIKSQTTPKAPEAYNLSNIDQGIDAAKKAGNKKLVKILTDAKGIMTALRTSNPTITIHNNQDSYTQAWSEAGGATQESVNQAFYVSNDGTQIHINLPLAESTNVVFHEGAHPVLDWLAQNKPEVVNRLYTELQGLASTLPGVRDAISFGLKNYSGVQARKEAIVEFMSMVANGQIQLPAESTTAFQKIIDFFNNLLNSIGIDFGVTITDADSVVEVARKFSDSIKEGRRLDIKSIDMATGPQAMIAGVNAELAQDVRGNLQVARDMEAANKDAKTIRIATGWEKGVDGLWRYEVPDNIPYLKDTVKKVKQYFFENQGAEDIGQKASYFLPPELIKLYPKLDEVLIVFNKRGDENVGSYDELAKIINVNIGVHPEKTVSVLLHEIQHAIQDIEGFDKGASPKDLLDTFISKEQALLDRIKKLEGPRGGNNPTAIENAKQDYRDFVKKFGTTKDGKKILDALDLYNRKAGEVEARNVQARMKMTPEQRRATTLQETERVARDSQIFLREGDMATGPQAMASQQGSQVNTIKNLIDQIKAKNPNVSDQNIYNALEQNGFAKEDINAAMGIPAPQEPAMPSYITPTPDVEPAVGPETRTLSVWERVAKKAESEGRIEDAQKIRELAQYDPQPNEITTQKAMEIAGLFGGVQQALDAIAEDASVKPVIRIALLGLKLEGAFAAGNNFNINTTLDELALSGLDYGRANAYFKEIYKKIPQLFYRAMITESLANSAAVMGNPNLPGTKMNGAVNATKRAKKQRDSFFDALSKYYAGEIDIYEFIGDDDKKFDAKTKNALKVLLNYGKLFSKEDKEKLSSLLKQLKDKGIFGMADTREDLMPILIAQMNDINGKLKIPLNENQIVEFANAMADFYEGIALTRLSDMLNGIFNDGSLSSDNLTAAAKAIMYGALNNNQTISVFAQAFNIPVLTQAQQNQLTVLAQQLANAKGTLAQSQAQYRFQQQMLYLQSQNLSWARQFSGKFKTMASLFEAYFYNAILSAFNTMFRAVRGNIGRTFGRVLFGLVRGDIELLRQSFSSVFFNTKIKNTFTITTSSGATITLNLENRVNETLDGVYSSIRGLPKLSEVKRSGLNQFELMLREEKSKGKRMAMRTFIVPASRMMSAVDAFTTPINQAITKRQVYYELIKEAYKQAGIKPKMADIYKAINQIMVPTADAYARAMEQARQDIIGSQIYSDLGFSPNGSDFPLQDPRIRKPLSREAKIYNEWLFRVKEIIDSEEFQRVKDSASSYGWEQGLGGVSIEETAKMVDEYTNKITSEITFLGRPRGSMGFLADSINNLIEKNMATKSLKFVGASSLFVNAGFNAVNMMIRIAPILNAAQLAKYYIIGTRGAISRKAEPEFGLPVATKLDKQQMLATVITTNVLFAAGVAALKGLYDDEEEEKDAITKKKWTGITNVRLTPAQEKLGYLPSRIYYKGEPQFDYKDSAWGPLFGFIAYFANYGIWSTDYTSNKLFVEPEKISYESLNDDDKSYIGSYIKYLFTIAGETSSIKDMSSTINGLIDFMAPDDEVETGGQIMSKLAEKKLSSFVKTAAIPYARLQGEIKGVYDAMTGAKKKEAIDFFDKVVIGTALEDVYIKTNGFDFWGEEIKDQFVIVHPLYSSKQIGETYPNNDLRELYRKNNFTPELSMNESLVHHINPKELNGGEAEFNEMLKSFEKTIKEKNEGITIETKKDNLLISYPLERNQVVEINRNTCRFVGWFFKFENGTNMKRAEAIKDKKVFREAIRELYSIGRDVAIYQGVYDNGVMGVQIMKEDKRDQYNRIANRIEAWKQRYTIEKEFEFVLKWPDQYDKTLLLGETFEFKPSVTISNQIKNNLSK